MTTQSVQEEVDNLHIIETRRLTTPRELKEKLSMTEAGNRTVIESRKTIQQMLRGKDGRVLVIVGPCSIHDEKAALEYAERLNRLRQEVNDQLYLVMRVYFEKPRTTIGWKGLINDPYLNGSSDIEYGLERARALLLQFTDMGLPTATEFLDPIVPQFISDLVSWAAIGARTTESQTHREMSSGLSMPVGFKNSTDGNLQIAIDAMVSSRSQHSFLGIDQDGNNSIVKTSGNVWGHLILRGGRYRTNYDPESIQQGVDILRKHNLPPYLMVDCSHANSSKKHQNQCAVWDSCIAQRKQGNEAIFGLMLESYLHEGNQSIPESLADLQYGVSITDACISWKTTEQLIRKAHDTLKASGPVKSVVRRRDGFGRRREKCYFVV